MGEISQYRKLSVLMPVYNERWTLRAIVDRVLASPVPLEIELVIVDDCSADGSWELIQDLAAGECRIKAIRHAQNAGKGSAIRAAISQMTGDIAVVQDADLEYDPQEFPALVAPILEGKADAVFGSRYAGTTRRVPHFWHTQVNRFLTLVCNVLNGLLLTDMETCYKVVRADILRQLHLKSKTFTLEPELTARLAQWGARIYEVPISYAGRSQLEGKKIRPIDGLKAIGEMLRCRFIDRQFTTHSTLGTLKACDQARGCHRWIYDQMREFVGQRVLHMNCGIGSLSGFFFNKQRLILAETEPLSAAALEQRFARRENLAIERASIANGFDVERWRREEIDTILWADWTGQGASLGLVHQCHNLIAAGGHCIYLLPVPSQAITGNAAQLLVQAGFEIVSTRSLGRAPRWLAPIFPPAPAGLARRISWVERLLPIVRFTDRWLAGDETFQLIVARKRAGQRERIAA